MNKHIIPILVILLLLSSGFVGVSTITQNISEDVEAVVQSIDDNSGPWPMYCHDVRHTGRSPYNIANNPGLEKWNYDTIDESYGSPTIDKDGTIYIGSRDLNAVYPNGTLKWKSHVGFTVKSAPAIDNNGIIYIGNGYGGDLFAIYTSNGTKKWKYSSGDCIFSSPAIGEDGTIYFGKSCGPPTGYITALYPNGTLRWRFRTEHAVYSSPAIGNNGTVYCGSHDGYIYALYPNNGTLRWKYKTGDWVGRGPSIADDGTIYFGSWDGYLYACYPNGTLKWKSYVHAGTTPVIGHDGTIYVGSQELKAINPNNGSIKWSFNPGDERKISGGNPCISADGIIVFGTHIDETDGGELIAVNPNGTERWRIMLATAWIWSAPAIDENGNIYVGSANDKYQSGTWGYLHAVGKLDSNAPSSPEIKGPIKIKPDIEYNYTFKSTSPIGNDIYYYIEWGDNRRTGWIGPYLSGEEITIGHYWRTEENYTIKARAKDIDNLWGPWGCGTKLIPTHP